MIHDWNKTDINFDLIWHPIMDRITNIFQFKVWSWVTYSTPIFTEYIQFTKWKSVKVLFWLNGRCLKVSKLLPTILKRIFLGSKMKETHSRKSQKTFASLVDMIEVDSNFLQYLENKEDIQGKCTPVVTKHCYGKCQVKSSFFTLSSSLFCV